MLPLRGLAVVLALIAVVVSLHTAEPATRVPWTTSKVLGSPEPPAPYRAVVAYKELKFDHPLLLARVPGTNLLCVGEQKGKIYFFDNKPDAKANLLTDLKKELKSIQQHPGAAGFFELYGLVFHPQFETNRECFICYTLQGKKGEKTGVMNHEKNLPDGTRVSRFKLKPGPDLAFDASSEEILLTWLQGGHNGGDLHFGPDGMLYISTGDAADPNPPDHFKTGQNITDLLASVLRIDVDHKDAGKNYAIPKDNPFVKTLQNGIPVRGEVWAYGLRNPWRMSFDRVTGDLFAGDVGWEAWEMIHKIERGGNYGWSIVEARQQVNTAWPVGPTPIRTPVIELDHALAASITGGYVYRGKKIPELIGKYIFADWSTRRMWAATLDGDRLVKLDEITEPSVRVVSYGEDHAGELYFLDYDLGTVMTLETNAAAKHDPAAFPRKLSETGLFKDLTANTPAEGVYAYEINAPQWQDGATALRWIALPHKSAVIDNDERRKIPGDVDWHQYKYHFPKDAVLVKTLSLATNSKEPAKRVETQLLHFDGVDWHGYSYQWRADDSDADLVPADGSERFFVIDDDRALGGKRELTWNFNSRTQCLQCHNFWAEYALGFNSPQLNRDVKVGESKRNQLISLCEQGLMTRADKARKPKPPHDDKSVKALPRLVDPLTPTPDIAGRARSYLHANCAHCHRFGGGGAVEFELTFNNDLNKGKVFDAPTRGHFDIPDARVVAKGDPKRSTLYYRLAKFGNSRMPHLGSELPDEAGLTLIHDWISELPGEAGKQPQGDHAAQLKSLRGGLELAKMASCECCNPDERKSILGEAKKLPAGTVRDLFEGYITPPGGVRKLGANPKPRTILNLVGDLRRGREIFLMEKLQCNNCHNVNGKGQLVGPDLVAVLGKRSKSDILDSLLEPNRRVDPAFQSYLLKTESGKSHTGLLVRRTDTEVVLKGADGKEFITPVKDVESLEPSRTSLMPSGLIADLTPQQAADLLSFLMYLKDAPR
ncbi:PQQ-dependent sugar dehydrogenase [soil metagenome]